MQPNPFESPSTVGPPLSGRWTKELTRYHWFVLIVAALGWLFDTMDQQLFILAREPAMRELLAPSPGVLPEETQVKAYSTYATSIFMLGWATGGLAFGVLGDRIGRVKTMLLTILIYSLFTGLSAFSIGYWDFVLYRFLTGLGVGGEFAVGVALVAEVMPERARPFALGLLQALSAVGNITAALLQMGLGHLERADAFSDLEILGTQVRAWRIMFVIGVLPALLAIVIRMGLKEPERWQTASAGKDPSLQLGSYRALFGDRRWRRNAIVGLLLACSGIIGLWGIGFFTFDLIGSILRKRFELQGMSGAELDGAVGWWKGIAAVMFNLGAFFGIYGFSYLAHFMGRRPAFAISYVASMLSTALVFGFLNRFSDIFWMVPLAGFCQLSLFGGFAIYFPELFPTRLRSTGTSFCYNVGRYVAAAGPAVLGLLTANVFADYAEPLRPAGLTMCSIFLLGLFVLPFAPETKGRPLPE